MKKVENAYRVGNTRVSLDSLVYLFHERQSVAAAGLAMESQKTSGQNPAVKKGTEFPFDEWRNGSRSCCLARNVSSCSATTLYSRVSSGFFGIVDKESWHTLVMGRGEKPKREKKKPKKKKTAS